MKQPKLAFKDKPITDQIELARRLCAGITAEASCAGKVACHAELEAAIAEAEAAALAVETARQEWRTAVTRRNEVLRTLRQKTRRAAQEVTIITGGDAAKMLGAGLELARSKTIIGTPPQPEGVRAEAGGHTGTVKVVWNRIALRKIVYQVQWRDRIDGTGEWQDAGLFTRRQCVVAGLESGRQYWFRVSAHGAAGPGPWSQPAGARAA